MFPTHEELIAIIERQRASMAESLALNSLSTVVFKCKILSSLWFEIYKADNVPLCGAVLDGHASDILRCIAYFANRNDDDSNDAANIMLTITREFLLACGRQKDCDEIAQTLADHEYNLDAMQDDIDEFDRDHDN